MSDREKLIDLMKEAYCSFMCGFGDEEKAKWLLELDIEINWEDIADHLIENDVVIQKQGEWHLNEDGKWACSECDGLAVVHPDEPDKWQALTTCCPNCGAKMKV